MVVVTMGDEAPADSMQALASAGRPPREFVVLRDIEKALAAYPDETLVVVLTSPAGSLLSALQEGTVPSLALARWKEQAEGQVRSLRKVRRRIIAFDSDALSANPQRCAEILTSRLHIPFDSAVVEASAPQAVSDSSALALVATLLIECDPDARALADEIEATLSVSSTHYDISVEQIDRAVAAFQTQSPAPAALEAERDLLRDDLVQMQEQLERAEMEMRLQHAASEAKDQRMATLTGKQLMRESILGAAILQYGALAEAQGAEIEALKAQVDALAPTARQLMRESTLGAAILQYGALAEALGAEIEALKAQLDALAPATAQSSLEQTAEPKEQPEAQAQETSEATPDEAIADSETASSRRSSKVKRSAPTRRGGRSMD